MLRTPLEGPLDTPLYRFAYRVVPLVLRVLFRMDVRGAQNVPVSGPVVIASNHLSNLDPIFVGAACPRQVHFMAKAELWRFGPLGRLVDALGAFPVRRGQADREAVRRGLQVLDAGAVMGMFPEGHRQEAGRLGQPQTGIGLFSLREGVTTIPVAVEGTDRIVRQPRVLPRVRVTFGPPVDLSPAEGRKKRRQRTAALLIMHALADLLGQAWSPEDTHEEMVRPE